MTTSKDKSRFSSFGNCLSCYGIPLLYPTFHYVIAFLSILSKNIWGLRTVITLTGSEHCGFTVHIAPEWQFLCTFSHSIHTDMARLLNVQLRSNSGRSETWLAACMQGYAVFISPSASVNLHNLGSQLNRQSRWQPFISPSDCRQPSSIANKWGFLWTRAKYHQLIINCAADSFPSKGKGKFVKGKSWWQEAIIYSVCNIYPLEIMEQHNKGKVFIPEGKKKC